MNKLQKNLDWHYTKWGGISAVKLFWFWSKLFRTTEYIIDVNKYNNKKSPVIFASNHMNRLDPPAIFSAVNFGLLYHFAPVKFMTAAAYYNSIFKLPLYTTGCYPHKGNGLTGVEGGVYFAKNGYNVFVFPEGKRNRNYRMSHNYSGISRIIEQVPEAKLILVNINWQERSKKFSRPKLRIIMKEAPEIIDYSNVDNIMEEIYRMGNQTNS